MNQRPTADYTRRSDTLRNTPAELAIRDAIVAVEKAGCDPVLTEAVSLLDLARHKVGDFVDREAVAIRVFLVGDRVIISEASIRQWAPEVYQLFAGKVGTLDFIGEPVSSLDGGMYRVPCRVIFDGFGYPTNCDLSDLSLAPEEEAAQ